MLLLTVCLAMVAALMSATAVTLHAEAEQVRVEVRSRSMSSFRRARR